MGYGDVGFNGATGPKTPNLDNMADEGMVFSDTPDAPFAPDRERNDRGSLSTVEHECSPVSAELPRPSSFRADHSGHAQGRGLCDCMRRQVASRVPASLPPDLPRL